MKTTHTPWALLVAGMLSSGYAKSSEVNVENLHKVSATVESVDHDKRLVSLRAKDGSRETIEVAPQVKNLDQVKAGDQVVVSYYEALAAQLKKKGERTTSSAVNVTNASATAAPGKKPAGLVRSITTTTVVIESVDEAANTVTFQGPAGTVRTVAVENPAARQFIKKLQKATRSS
jgi:hypothetical protein